MNNNVYKSSEKMSEIGEQFISEAIELRHLFKKYFNEVNTINECWDGDDSKAYILSVENYLKKINSLCEMIYNYGTFMVDDSDKVRQIVENLNRDIESGELDAEDYDIAE